MDGAFGLDRRICGILMALAAFAIASGGLGRISAACGALVPFMTAGFTVLSAAALVIRAPELPRVFREVMSGAFSFISEEGARSSGAQAIFAGIGGFFVSRAVRYGVMRELVEEDFDEASVEKYVALYENCDAVSVSEFAADRLGGNGADIAASLESIMRCATAATAGGCSLKFDPTLVRGMSYYTGTIFEISMDGYGYSVGGGGRYDEMLAKFSGQKTPACGFSLGFERIVAALADRGFEPPAAERSVAFLASKNMDEQKMLAMLSDAARLRADGARVLVTPRMKNVGFQKTKLADDGYTEFVEY